MVQTTKSQSPFTQFDARYYNNLKRVSFEKAEEYRKSVTAPKKETIDLGKIHAERNEDFPTEHEVRGIEPTAEQQAHQPRPNTIDLGKQLENKGVEGVQQPKDDGQQVPPTPPQAPTANPGEDIQEGPLSETEKNATPDAPVDLAAALEQGKLNEEPTNQDSEKPQTEPTIQTPSETGTTEQKEEDGMVGEANAETTTEGEQEEQVKENITNNEPADAVELSLEEVQAKLKSMGVPNHDQFTFEEGVEKLTGLGAL